MTSQKANTAQFGPAENWLYRLGSIAAFAIAVAYIAIIGLYATVGALPVGGEEPAELSH